MSAVDTATVPSSVVLPASAAPAALPACARPANDGRDSSLGLTQIATLVLWSGCLAVGILGFILSYTRPHAPAKEPAPVVVGKLEVVLAPDVPPTLAAAADALSTPPPPSAIAPAAPAQPLAVADPTAVAFALPVDGPTVVVDAARAAHARPAVSRPDAATGAALPAPQTLVFGRGEGRQPAPEYPASARKRHQQGTVGVRFMVTPEGRVRDVSVAAASPWPALDESALRTVRHRWHFPRGAVRVYDVAIRFALAD